MKVLHGIAKPVIPQPGRLGRCWPSSQAEHSSPSIHEAVESSGESARLNVVRETGVL